MSLDFRASTLGRECAYLGAWLIGEVGPNPGGTQQRAWARLYLPGLDRSVWPATSIAKAKEILQHKAGEWIDASGLSCKFGHGVSA